MREREEQANKLSTDILDKFFTLYFDTLKEVIYERHKESVNSSTASSPPLSPNSKSEGGKVRRPRGVATDLKASKGADPAPSTSSNFSTKIICSQSVEVPAGSYIVYVIFTKAGEERALVYRRFKEFRELSAFIDRKKKAMKLPPRAGTKLESRNLKSELIATRSQLLGDYLKSVNESAEVQEIKEVQKWLGIGIPADPVMIETFKRTYFRLKAANLVWKKSIFHHNVDAIYKLVCDKIRLDVYPELDRPEGVPQKELAKIKESYVNATSNLETAVNKSAASINEQISHVKHQSVDFVTKKYDKIQQLEASARKNARQLLAEIFKSSWPKIKEDLVTLTNALDAPLLQVLQKLTHFQILHGSYQKSVNFDGRIKEILVAASPEKIDEFEKVFARLKQSVKSHLTVQFSFALPPIVENLDKQIQTDNFQILQHVTLLPDLIGAVLDLADPANLFIVIRQILDCKYALLQEHPVNIKKIEDTLDRYEQLAADKIWWSQFGLEYSGYYSFYELWDVVGNLGPYADVYKTFFLELDEINGRVLTKFSHKFGDLIHVAIKKEVRDWKDTIDTSVLTAYDAAKKSAVKAISKLTRKFVAEVIRVGISPQARKIVLGPLVNLYHPVQGVPLDELDQVLPQDRLYEQVFDDILRENIDGFVATLSEKFVAQYELQNKQAQDEQESQQQNE